MASTPRWQCSTASIRLRVAAASTVTTCMSTPSRLPSMPRGSRMLRVSSSAKPIGSECSTARPSRTEWRLPAASTRSVSASFAVEPRKWTVAANCSLAMRPAETETKTDSMCTPAMRSAASSAWWTASSAATKSITVPAFMPRAWVCASPSTSIAWLRRRSTSCGERGVSRPIKQTILLVPISSAHATVERRGDSGFIFGVSPSWSELMRRLPCACSSCP